MTIAASFLLLAMLADSAPAAAAAATAKPITVAPEDKVICRREPIIGTLARTRKECHTKAEWERIASETQSKMRKMIDNRPPAISDN